MAGLLSESKERLTGLLRKEKSTSSDQSNEDRSYQKRRAQVRRAQKSHRERKKEYISGIEQELRQVRDQHVKQMLEVENENRYLRSILAAHQISVPPMMRDAPALASVGSRDSPKNVPHLRVTRAQSNIPQMSLSISPTGVQSNSMIGDNGTLQGGLPRYAGQLELEEIQKAVNFILALEDCCVDHLHIHQQADCPSNAGSNVIDPTSHELLMAQQLLNQRPVVNRNPLSEDPSWEVSLQTVQNLLRLSDQFAIPGELTPAQAWRNVQQFPDFLTISPNRFLKLQTILAREVKCYGFGAVLDKNILKVALEAYITGASCD